VPRPQAEVREAVVCRRPLPGLPGQLVPALLYVPPPSTPLLCLDTILAPASLLNVTLPAMRAPTPRGPLAFAQVEPPRVRNCGCASNWSSRKSFRSAPKVRPDVTDNQVWPSPCAVTLANQSA
jgi:hypothetical protein